MTKPFAFDAVTNSGEAGEDGRNLVHVTLGDSEQAGKLAVNVMEEMPYLRGHDTNGRVQ